MAKYEKCPWCGAVHSKYEGELHYSRCYQAHIEYLWEEIGMLKKTLQEIADFRAAYYTGETVSFLQDLAQEAIKKEEN